MSYWFVPTYFHRILYMFSTPLPLRNTIVTGSAVSQCVSIVISLNISSWCSAFSHVRLSATPWTVTHQAPLSMEFFQTRILEWVTLSSSRGSSLPRNWTFVSYVSCIGRRILYHQRHLGSPPLNSFSVLSFVNPALIHACTTRSFYKSMTIRTFLNEEW